MDNKILRKRTIAVIVVTVLMMIAEIYFGIINNSMALTADGFHMGTHVLAFGITLTVCLLAVKFQDKTEKLNALGGYTSAILLGLTSLGIIWESVERFFNPLSIGFNDAILVAIIGLAVNLLCIFIMGGENLLHNHQHSHCSCGQCEHHHEEHEENLNYKAAYLHILADAMTSVLAIGALLLGKYFGLTLLDPVIGIVGGLVIGKWSLDLLKTSSKILLDFE
jgi:cation diffusion facilitator family transporter